jgi:hypothetical protein
LIASATTTDVTMGHSNRWPRMGLDKLVLIGGETNFRPVCAANTLNGGFSTWDGSHAYKDGKMNELDTYYVHAGAFVDGAPPANALGCSVHWFEEHPTFHDGGLMALAAYEHGTRFLQIKPDGKIVEQGWFLPLGGSTSAPHWAPDGKTVYLIDYARGFDVVQWLGPTYVTQAAAATASPSPTPTFTPLPSTTASATSRWSTVPALGLIGLVLGSVLAARLTIRRRRSR